MANTPKIRFKGFTDDWEQHKLGELTSIASAARVHKEDWTDAGVPFFRSSDVVAAYKQIDNEKAFITKELYGKLSAISGKLEKDDILITGGGSIGIPYIVPNNEPLYSKDADLIWIKHSHKFDSQYLYSYITAPVFRSYIGSISHTGTIAHYTIEQVKATPVALPSIKEQEQIGRFFRFFDNLIIFHQRTVNETKELKRFMLQKMFPKKGERIPEIRFFGFTDAWEQRKAEDLFTSTADKGHPELPVLSATQDCGMIRRDENSINVFHDKKNEIGYKRVLPGQFVIHLRSFQGGFAHSSIEGITSPAYTVFGFSEPDSHDSEYWKYVFTSKEFIRRLETVTYGIRDGRSISYDEFLTLDFTYPCKREQTKIALFLDELSNLITLHQRKCDELKDIKKVMLKNMFV